jgi:hypothetical protein
MSDVEGATLTPNNSPQPAVPGPTPGAAPFVWGVWAALLLLALFYVSKFGSRLPYYDDWALVPLLTGAEPLTPTALWAQYNEHRVPLPRLMLYALGKLSGFDFRAGMFFNVALLGGLSFLLLRTARRLRGHLHFADAFLPLLVLSLAQWESLLIDYALNLVGSTVVAGTILLLLAGSGPQVSPRRSVLMAACVMLLPLFGASGLVLVPALALWLAFVGVVHCRAAGVTERRWGLLVLGLVAVALLLCGAYFVGYQHAGWSPLAVKPTHTLARGLQVLGMLFGASGLPFALLKACVVPALLLAGGGVWLVAWCRKPQERVILLGFLAFLLAMGCLAGAVACGRADYLGSTGLVPRYTTLMVPLGCCLYFLGGRYGGASGAPATQMVLFLLAAVVFVPNLRTAFDAGRSRRLALTSFETNLAAGVPPALLAECGADRVFPAACKDAAAQSIAGLRDAGAAAFRSLPEDAPLRVAALPASVVSLREMIWTDGVARPVGGDPAVEVALPQAEFVYAVRLHYVYTNILGSPDLFAFSWRRTVDDVSPWTRGPKVLLEAGPGSEGDRTVTVWVNDRVDRVQLVPRIKMFALRLAAVELVLPEPAATPSPRVVDCLPRDGGRGD